MDTIEDSYMACITRLSGHTSVLNGEGLSCDLDVDLDVGVGVDDRYCARYVEELQLARA